MSGPATGGHLGRKLGDILADAHAKTRAALLPAEADHRARFLRATMEQFEGELAPVAGKIFGAAMADPDCPDDLRDLLSSVTQPHQQTAFLLQLFALPFAIFSLASAAEAGNVEYFRQYSLQRRPVVPLPPEALAAILVKGAVEEGWARDEAQKSGIDGARFDNLVRGTGDPPGPEELMQALRRGIIDRGRFEHGIRQGRTKNEWLDVMHALRHAPPGAGQVIAAAVEGHLSEGEARHRLDEAGIDPANYPWLYETAGRPPGTQEMIELWRRGDATEADVHQAIRESDVKNKYIGAILKMKRHVPPPRSVVAMLRHGSIDDGLAREMLRAGGVEGRDADVMIRDGHHQATTNIRQLAAGEVVSAYTDGIIDRAGAQHHLETIRYSGEDAGIMLAVADLRRERRYAEAAIGRVRSTYVGHHIPRNEASVMLDNLGVPSDQRDHLIHLWDLERGANVKTLTEAQVAKARKQDLIDDAEFVRRLLALGYTQSDAALLLRLQNPAPTTGSLNP